METTEQENLLSDLESSLVRATAGKRLANFIIDRILYLPFSYACGLLIGTLSMDFAYLLNSNKFVEILTEFLLFAIFMGLQEALFKGRSIGKFITQTKAVNIDGSTISAQTAFARGFSRIVPFEPFSAFGDGCNPWHDRWNNTMVIDIKESTIIEQY